jgi:hypothetical protein
MYCKHLHEVPHQMNLYDLYEDTDCTHANIQTALRMSYSERDGRLCLILVIMFKDVQSIYLYQIFYLF